MVGVLYFIRWYYTIAVLDGIYIAGNYCWNIARFFSTKALLKTLFSPYRRVQDETPSFFSDTSGFFEAIIGNLISRIVGAFVRVIILFISLISFIWVVCAASVLLALWMVLPILVPYLLFQSIELLI